MKPLDEYEPHILRQIILAATIVFWVVLIGGIAMMWN